MRAERQAQAQAAKAEADRATLAVVETAFAKGLAQVSIDSLTTSHVLMLVALLQASTATRSTLKVALRTLLGLSTPRMDEAYKGGLLPALVPLLTPAEKEVDDDDLHDLLWALHALCIYNAGNMVWHMVSLAMLD